MQQFFEHFEIFGNLNKIMRNYSEKGIKLPKNQSYL